MAEILPPLSAEESTLLQLMAQGESIADLGEHSRWSEPLRGLVARGYATKLDQHNHVITTAGKVLAVQAENDDVRSLVGLNNALCNRRQDEQSLLRDLQAEAKIVADKIKAAIPRSRWQAAERAFIDEFTSHMNSP